MVDRNIYIKQLEQQVHQVQVFQAVQARSKWIDTFSSNKIEISSFGARYVITMPKEGLNWKPDLSVHKGTDASDTFRREVNIAYIDIGPIIDKVYYDIIVEDRFQEALDNPSILNQVTTQLKQNIAIKVISDINKGLKKIWTNENNYLISTTDLGKGEIPNGNLHKIHPSYFKDNDWVLGQLFDTGDAFLEESTLFQKGFCPKEDAEGNPIDRTDKTNWIKVETNTLDETDIIVILDNSVKNNLKIGKYSQAPNASYVELKNTYGKVENCAFPNNFKMLMMDNRVTVLRPKENKLGLLHKFEQESQTNWFFLPSKVFGGMVTCLNYVAWQADDTKQAVPTA